MSADEGDTIVALATPPGEAGLAVIRVSGAAALAAVDRGFRGKRSVASAASHTALYGRFMGPEGEVIDDVVVVVFRGPNSYTGEDTAELMCHGGPYVSRQIVQAMRTYGARYAKPGEFTKRAFLNGRMDLSQAEAVADLIHSHSELAHRASRQQLEGALSGKVRGLRERLIRSIGLIELELDFTEEGYEFFEKGQVRRLVCESLEEVESLLSSFGAGRLVREGVKVVLSGSPNVGKSSLLNLLLEEERAIVTEIPGTTRDTLEESIHLRGLTFRLVDTAGIRTAADAVEEEGIRRAERQVTEADIIVLLFDRSRSLEHSDEALARRVLTTLRSKKASALVVLNKADLPDAGSGEIVKMVHSLGVYPTVELSCKTGTGVGEFKNLLVEMVGRGTVAAAEGSVVITNQRHHAALAGAKDSLKLALASIDAGRTGELVAVDLRQAAGLLGEIVGEVTTDDILNDIFSKFCIGK
jgi:tRNA modification GTPase